MRILIFGITGMLGHILWQKFKEDFEVYGTVRESKEDLIEKYSLFKNGSENIIDNVNAMAKDSIDKAIETANPNVVVNCIGIIKQAKEAGDALLSIFVNALFPHILTKKCKARNIRLIHISTDCVFSGKKSRYRETDISDAEDLYGRTKYLGEVNETHCLTVRTSLIGPELREKRSLLEWFLVQQGQAKGYRKAIFSGFTTYAFAEILKEIIQKYPKLTGVYHIASVPVNKYELLCRLKRVFDKDITIIADDTVVIDRSLDAAKFIKETSIKIPNWDEMMEDLKGRVVNDFSR